MTAYDPQNIFAKILNGEFASTKVYENDHLLAIMDVFPQSKGHMPTRKPSPASRRSCRGWRGR